MRPTEEFDAVQRLIAAGLNDCAIARQTSIPRRTVRDWRCRPQVLRRQSSTSSRCVHDFASLPPNGYSYLLGLYLGDGCISRYGRVWRLRITLDAQHPDIIERCKRTIDAVTPGQHAAAYSRSDNCAEDYLYSKHWPCLFPQHGPGKKHHRPIRLEPWQRALVNQATEEFIRGLYCAALDRLGIPWTQNSRYEIAVYRKAATARLDEFVGPKS